MNNIRQEEPIITEEKMPNMNNFLVASLMGFMIMIVIFVGILFMKLGFSDSLILILIAIIVYSIVLFFLLEPRILRKIHTKEIETIETPIIRTVERPVIREVVRTVEKPVIRKVFVEKPRKKLNIPKYDYLGSTETKTYHKRSCRFSKLIKRKYKVSNNDPNYFKRRGYKACKVCIKNN